MESINVFATSDDNYAPYVATTIASIMKHTASAVNFFIIDCNISESNRDRIKKEEMFFKNLYIEFIKINADQIFYEFPSMIHLSIAMYGKYLISVLKPEIKRIIYTDVDVAFTGDILELWNENLDGFIMGAVPSQRYRLNNNYYELKKRLGIEQAHIYFMSGLMLIDCEAWRKHDITSKLLKKTSELQTMPDQEVLNVIFSTNNYKMLDVKYCVIYKIFNECYSKEEIRKYIRTKVIVHYPGGGMSKPWNNPFLKSGRYFNNCIKYTDFKKDIRKGQFEFLCVKIKGKLLRK